MLWTVVVILILLWALGLLTGTTVNGLVHILLIFAVIVVILELIRGGRRRRS